MWCPLGDLPDPYWVHFRATRETFRDCNELNSKCNYNPSDDQATLKKYRVGSDLSSPPSVSKHMLKVRRRHALAVEGLNFWPVAEHQQNRNPSQATGSDRSKCNPYKLLYAHPKKKRRPMLGP